MKLYKCAWPNGSISFVLARNKNDAIFLLDEWGDASAKMLVEVRTFMVDLEINIPAVVEAREHLDACDDASCFLPPEDAYTISFSAVTRDLFEEPLLEALEAALARRDAREERSRGARGEGVAVVTRAVLPFEPPIIPIDWSDYTLGNWAIMPTSKLVRFVARAELLIHSDGVRARSAGAESFRRGLAECYAELDARLPREE